MVFILFLRYIYRCYYFAKKMVVRRDDANVELSHLDLHPDQVIDVQIDCCKLGILPQLYFKLGVPSTHVTPFLKGTKCKRVKPPPSWACGLVVVVVVLVAVVVFVVPSTVSIDCWWTVKIPQVFFFKKGSAIVCQHREQIKQFLP